MRINGRRHLMYKEVYATIDDDAAREIILKNWGEADGKHVLVKRLAMVTSIGTLFQNSAIKETSWLKYFPNITELVANTFYGCSSLTSADLSMITPVVYNLSNLFYKCSSLKEVKFGHWDGAKLRSIQNMFNGCKSLKDIDFSPIRNVQVDEIDSYTTFGNMGSMNSISFNGWQIKKISNFAFYGTGVLDIYCNGCPDEFIEFLTHEFGWGGHYGPNIHHDGTVWVWVSGNASDSVWKQFKE